MKDQELAVYRVLGACAVVVQEYSWLLDCYVLDHYVDHHWTKLPTTWQLCFNNMDPATLGHILTGNPPNMVLPLSFLAVVKTVNTLSLNRQPTDVSDSEIKHGTIKRDHRQGYTVGVIEKTTKLNCGNHPRLRNLFLKHVKAKKRHEISRMCNVVERTAAETGCSRALDVGSGVGHLARSLAYQHDLNVVGVEREQQLIEEARKLDLQLEYTASKHLSREAVGSLKRPAHLNVSMTPDTDILKLCQSENLREYGVIGLHPCGDLGPLLLRHFASCDNVKFICVVGCCHMKLTCKSKGNGYPMSRYLNDNPCHLSYESRELSCHAVETYFERLRCGDYRYLQVHAYRAALEVILLDIDKNLKHTAIKSIKHTNKLSFQRYCERAVERINVDLPLERVLCEETQRNLRDWRKVVIFYTLRLTLAPLVETIILLDRVLYLLEQGRLSCDIRPVFNPRLSPRNHIIVGKRL